MMWDDFGEVADDWSLWRRCVVLYASRCRMTWTKVRQGNPKGKFVARGYREVCCVVQE